MSESALKTIFTSNAASECKILLSSVGGAIQFFLSGFSPLYCLGAILKESGQCPLHVSKYAKVHLRICILP